MRGSSSKATCRTPQVDGPTPPYTVTMSDPGAAPRATADPVLRALRRTRQVRQFTDEPVTETDLSAILTCGALVGQLDEPSAMDVHRHPRQGRP